MRDLETRLADGTVGELKQTTHPQPDSPATAQIDDGGPAFPGAMDQLFYSRDGELQFASHYVGMPDPGMTLRDYFAAQAASGILVGCASHIGFGSETEFSVYGRGPCNKGVAERAYAIADAMLAVRKGGVA